jgi:hypothetical protein
MDVIAPESLAFKRAGLFYCRKSGRLKAMPQTTERDEHRGIFGENPWFYSFRNAGLDDASFTGILKTINRHGSISATSISPVEFEKGTA